MRSFCCERQPNKGTIHHLSIIYLSLMDLVSKFETRLLGLDPPNLRTLIFENLGPVLLRSTPGHARPIFSVFRRALIEMISSSISHKNLMMIADGMESLTEKGRTMELYLLQMTSLCVSHIHPFTRRRLSAMRL